MANLLYLVHRLPFPPDKGDKVRSYHLLRHLASRHRVHLGTFIDDPADEAHAEAVRALCADLHIVRIDPRMARIRSLAGLASGEALSVRYYRDAGLRAWVRGLAGRIDAAVVFSSAMTPYADILPDVPMLLDFVDVDSEKWSQYAEARRWPMSWVYRREGRRLLAHDRDAARRARRSFFVTDKEAGLFRRLAPETAATVDAVGNGVNAEFFAPDPQRPSPFDAGRPAPLVFTGAMDYWPNIDAVTWFVADMLPQLQRRRPGLRFYIVGRSPPPAVQALASDAVVVTGTVPDVRPYLQHAGAVVAPLRIARGIQNKILEAMAMARPVVAAQECAEAIDARVGADFLAAARPEDYVAQLDALLGDPQRADAIGRAGRQQVLDAYSWEARLSAMDAYLPAPGASPSAPVPARLAPEPQA
ncbi:MAG: TIGR03087 family PEP-CTERM/XrtA system glycosyltransferase [Xylophilus ampelinus]